MHAPSNSAVRRACEWIEEGDFDRARAELGFTDYSLAPHQADDLRFSLERAAVKFNKPELATRGVLKI